MVATVGFAFLRAFGLRSLRGSKFRYASSGRGVFSLLKLVSSAVGLEFVSNSPIQNARKLSNTSGGNPNVFAASATHLGLKILTRISPPTFARTMERTKVIPAPRPDSQLL